ncbi:hypothetical protein HK104_007787, partial [Borealophlyctis nickersoniae]
AITSSESEVVSAWEDRSYYYYNGYIDSEEKVKIWMCVEVERPLGGLLEQYFEITMDDDLSNYLDPI